MRNFFTANSPFNCNKRALQKLSCKQMALFVAACARSVLHIFEKEYAYDDRPRLAIEAAERFDANFRSIAHHAYVAGNVFSLHNASSAVAYAAYYAAYTAGCQNHVIPSFAANGVFWVANAYGNANNTTSDKKWDWIYFLYQAAYREGKLLPSSWETETTIGIAQNIVETKDFSAMPILADALEDVGCDDVDILEHLRNDRGLWALSDWTLFNLRNDLNGNIRN